MRVSTSTVSVRVRRGAGASRPAPAGGLTRGSLMELAFAPEWLGGGIERAERADEIRRRDAHGAPKRRHGSRVRRLGWPETGVAAAVVRGTDRAAAGLSDRTEAGRAMRHHHARRPAPVAFETYARRRKSRFAAVKKRREHLEELALVDRTAAQLIVDEDVLDDRRGLAQRGQVVGRGVDGARELGDVREVPERLDAARGRTRPDRDQGPRLAPDLVDALGVVRRRDGALDEGDVIRHFLDRA